jgi:hypothetical protein
VNIWVGWEQHITFAGVLGIALGYGKHWVRDHDIGKRIRQRLDTLWYDRCAEKQEPYVPVENGVTAVIPPRPR